jgi:RNA polymerase sigma-70 factor (ECF subfamily)
LVEEARTRPTGGDLTARDQDLRDAIERLRPEDREVLRLVLWEQLTHAEAAVVLGCSVNAVAQRLHTARQRLRADLTRPTPGPAGMTTRS